MFSEILDVKKKIRIAKPEKKVEYFRKLKPKDQASLIFLFSNKTKKYILDNLSDDEILSFFHFLAPDDITDILQILPKKRQKKILAKTEKEIKQKVEFLLKFNPKSAAGIMSLDYIIVDFGMPMKDIAKLVKKHEERTGRVPLILVSEKNKIIGELPWHNLVINDTLDRKAVKRLPKIKYFADKSEVISVFKANPHQKVLVLDDDDSVLGIIYSDDIMDLIEETINESIYNFAGVEKEEDVLDSFLLKVKNRYKWLIINLITAFLAAFVVSLFESTIAKFVVLAAYMPIVAGMGGNAGTQAMAVMVRGLALKEVDWKNAKKVIFNEMLAGALNGFIIGLLLALVAFLLHQNPLLGLILGIALVINLLLAGFFGSVIPFFLKLLGKDPATVSSIFITTFTDVFGFLVFLGLATLIL